LKNKSKFGDEDWKTGMVFPIFIGAPGIGKSMILSNICIRVS